MGYSIEAINGEDNSVKKREALQEQLLKANLLQDGKIQKDGTRVEDPTAITSAERKTDTINISTEGQLALEQMKASKTGNTALFETPNMDKTKTDVLETVSAQKKGSSAAAADLKTKSDSEKSMYSMSKSELNTLASEGLLSPQEVKNELKRRSEISFPPASQQ